MHYLLNKVNVTRVVYTLLICCLLTPLRCANTNIILQTAFKHSHSIFSAPPTYSCDPGYASTVGTKQSCCLSTFYLLKMILRTAHGQSAHTQYCNISYFKMITTTYIQSI